MNPLGSPWKIWSHGESHRIHDQTRKRYTPLLAQLKFILKKKYVLSLEIDQIIGCGQRNGQRFFLVRFKNGTENEVIDWEIAKLYSLQVMEFFGSRLVWAPLQVDPEQDQNDLSQREANSIDSINSIPSTSRLDNAPSTSRLDNAPNKIDYRQ